MTELERPKQRQEALTNLLPLFSELGVQVSLARPVSSQKGCARTLPDMRVFHGAHVSSTTTSISKPPRPDTKIHFSTTSSQCPLKTRVLSLWVSSAPRRQTFKTIRHTRTHLDPVFTTPSTPESSRRVHQEPLGHQEPSKFTIQRATRQWRCASRPPRYHARLCGRDSDKLTIGRLLPWDHKLSLIVPQPSTQREPPPLL